MPVIGGSIERLCKKYKEIENMVGKKNGLKKMMQKITMHQCVWKSILKMFHLSICVEFYSPKMF